MFTPEVCVSPDPGETWRTQSLGARRGPSVRTDCRFAESDVLGAAKLLRVEVSSTIAVGRAICGGAACAETPPQVKL